MEFRGFPKLARLNRDIVITEKIDGTNAAVVVEEAANVPHDAPDPLAEVDGFKLWAQSRKRLITPSEDNYGFAKWVVENAEKLALLGPGHHYGEWWGQGIQRKYDLDEKRFSLFNVARWRDAAPSCCHVVPVLDEFTFSQSVIQSALGRLRDGGSVAAPGFMRPEGIVVYHTAARTMFKVTLEDDDKPKSAGF